LRTSQILGGLCRQEFFLGVAMKNHKVTALLFGVIVTASAAKAQQPPPLRVNVPYTCPGNMIVVVKHCEMRGGAEVCSLVKGAPNGPLGNEISMPKAQAAALGAICTTQGGPTSQSVAGPAAGGRGLNPPYLSEMPSPDRVLAAMKTNDPRETAVRQIWAFYELTEIIRTLMGDRESSRTGMLPDEEKILRDYLAAQYKVSQETDKAFPTNKPSEDLTYHFSRWDPKFGFKGINIWQFFSDNLQSQFTQIVAKDNARYAALRAEQKRVAAQGVSADPQATVPRVQQGMKNDPGRVALRRCVESGRSEMECLSEGLKVGLKDLAGGDMVAAITGETAAQGLRLTGSYSGSTGNKIHLAFNQDKVVVTCGPLIAASYPYEVERAANQISVKISISPKPLVVAFRPDNRLAGPADVAVHGLVPIGHGGGGSSAPAYQTQTQTTTRERQIDAAEAQNYAGTDAVHQNGMEYSVTEQVTSTSYEPAPVANYQLPPMAPKTEQCTAGIMQGSSSSGSVMESLTQVVAPSAKQKPPVPPGLRLAGVYAGQSGLRIEFREDSATVECGETHVAQTYSMQDNNGQVLLKIENGATPIALDLQANGTLVGSGVVDIAGRLVTGSTDNALTYAARNARCAVGTLTPQK